MASDGGPFQQQLLSMVALGRNFKIGDLYDYRYDQILKGLRVSWDTATLSSATGVLCKFEDNFSCDAEFTNKDGCIGIDNHLNMSITSGLISNFHGASNFINDQPDPRQAAYTFIIRTQVREEHLDLEKLVSQQVPRLVGEKGEEESELDATHIVTSVCYGGEAYCVFVQDVDGGEADEEARQEIIQQLSQIGKEWQSALRDFKHLDQFKQQLNSEQKHQATRINCRLYADFQVEPVVECNFFDAYKQCLQLMKTMYRKETGNSTAIPIAIRLCPLKCLVDPIEMDDKKFDYRDIDDCKTIRYSELFVGWKRVVIRAEQMCNRQSTDCSSLREFIDTIVQYQNLVRMKLKCFVPKLRKIDYFESDDRNVTWAMDKAASILIYQPLQLEKWLDLKQSEVDMMSWMASRTVDGMTLLADGTNLNERLSCNKLTVVLFVPVLDGTFKLMLKAMKETFLKIVAYNDLYFAHHKDEDLEEPWYMIHPKRKLVLDKIGEFSQYVEKNKKLENKVQFIVTFSDSSKLFGCSYSIYEGDTLLKSSLRRLPGPPSGLQVQHPLSRKAKKANTTSSVRVFWDYEILGYPCHFLVEYRVKNGPDSWIQLRTTKPDTNQMTVTFETGQTLEIRVAADTCIGRSDFSEVISTEPDPVDAVPAHVRADRSCLHPPIDLKVKSVTRTTAELERTLQPGNLFLCTRILYWKKVEGHRFCDEVEMAFDESSCLLEDLEPETKYQFNMATIADDWTNNSVPSESVEFTTLARDLRFAEKLVERSKKIGLDLFAVPLTKFDGRLKTAERFAFGEEDVNKKRPHRTIFLVGTSGKMLINSMANYIFDVSPEDPFRFQLMDPSTEESGIQVYDIHHAKGLRIDYSLTVIVAPNFYEQFPKKNKEFAKWIRAFFDDENGIHKLDLVGLVMDSSESDLMSVHFYIYCLLISIFGNDVKDKINFLLDCVDEEEPELLNAIAQDLPLQPPHHKFNSLEMFSKKPKDVSNCLEYLHKFFNHLAATTSKIVTFPKQLLDEKNRLEAVVYGLQDRIKSEVVLLTEIRKVREFSEFQEDVELEVERNNLRRVSLAFGEYVTNCTQCKMTCHLVCGIKGDKVDCDVMDHSMPQESRTCRVCPGECLWSVHRNEPARWEKLPKKKKLSLKEVKEKYESSLKKTLTLEELTTALDSDVESQEEHVMSLLETVVALITQLCKVTKRLDANAKSPCVDVTNYVEYVIAEFIRFVEENRREGFNEKIDALKKLREIAKSNVKGILEPFFEVRRIFVFPNNQPVEFEEESGEDSDEEVEVEETDGEDSSQYDSN